MSRQKCSLLHLQQASLSVLVPGSLAAATAAAEAAAADYGKQFGREV